MYATLRTGDWMLAWRGSLLGSYWNEISPSASFLFTSY